MSQPRYNQAIQEFIRQWRPNNDRDHKFVEDVKALLAAILRPPDGNSIDVTTLLSKDGGKVVVRLGDNEAQLEPVGAHHLALSLIEAAASARIESWMYRFMQTKIQMPHEIAAQMIGEFRNYRIEEMNKELSGELEKQTAPPKDGAPGTDHRDF